MLQHPNIWALRASSSLNDKPEFSRFFCWSWVTLFVLSVVSADSILDLSINDTKLKMILPEEEAINYDTGQNIKISFNIDNSYLFASDTGVSALN